MARRKSNEIQVLGLRELNRDLRKLKSKGLMNDLRAAHKKASERAAKAAAEEAPVRSGKLKKSIKPKATNREGRIKAGTPSRTPYAGPIHFGWKKRGIEANMFAYRGIKKVLKDIQKDYEDDVNRVAKKLGKRLQLPMKIKIDMAKLTLGDMEDFEDITGSPIQAMSKFQKTDPETGEVTSDGLPTKFLTALILIGQRKNDPTFDLAAARELPVQELDLEVLDSLNPPSESD